MRSDEEQDVALQESQDDQSYIKRDESSQFMRQSVMQQSGSFDSKQNMSQQPMMQFVQLLQRFIEQTIFQQQQQQQSQMKQMQQFYQTQVEEQAFNSKHKEAMTRKWIHGRR
eukprot:TRINITY_DN4290_c0_g1_i1.p1 TRINITY_DN4290_c0_g1~~TRINITY_DN4290_c0_g1_i1.p1  ORF type:complete len:128 (+),score=27.79 TRINITY_DN4290_c0_g1_i1:51-386(+)